MPSPFPGMDPYLEEPELWRDARHWFISATAEQLQPQLNRRGYFVAIESRLWSEKPRWTFFPDVASLQSQQLRSTPPDPSGGTVLADEPVRLQVLEVELREDYLQIYDSETRELITGIEIVSPSNKADSKARKMYLRKRKKLSAAEVNLVEVDLLRAGKPLVRLPKAVLEKFQPGGYLINVVRVDSLDYEFYPLDLRSRLPRVGIPVRAGEPDVVLDVQAARARVYESGAYQLRIDYNRPPGSPLSDEDEIWANERLISLGVRSASP